MLTGYVMAKGLKCSSFSTSTGATETFLTATASDGISFKEATEELAESYASVLNDNGLDDTTLQFTRFYFSDIVNDYKCLIESKLFGMVKNGAVSFIQQAPLAGGQLGILVYHIKSDSSSKYKKTSFGIQKIYTEGEHYSLLWNAGLSNKKYKDSAMQSLRIFSDLSLDLKNYGMNVRNNTLRTWIYVRDVDNNYAGMIDARRELFNVIGLTADTRYIASTGIEGQTYDTSALVAMDALSIQNIKEEQIIKMEALENLSSTAVYGVTFERGTRLRFGDRSHMHISGTASIDNLGNIMYESDIRRQTVRTLDNIKALLSPHGATLSDMQYLIIYLRNTKHLKLIEDLIAQIVPENVPLMPVEGPVCRPGWLIEMEGVAIIPDKTNYPPFF
jgi:enamine deaminase RidA (YjgF/YER057c/UK114 family)